MNLLPLKSPITFLFVLLLTACSTGSTVQKADVTPRPALRPADDTGELVVDGVKRTYYLHIPKTYKPNHPLPLVLAFHGYGSQGKDLALSTGFNELADKAGFIIVYPNGIDKRWHVTSNWFTSVDDVTFVSALIAQLTKISSIDRNRIYATGVSNGGFLVQRLACEPKSQFAAFASVVATLPGELQSSCHPQSPVSMLMINGTNDHKVPWEGGSPPKVPYGWILSVPATINFWRQHDDCPATPQTNQLPGGRVEISRYLNCRGGAEVELVTLKGVGHVWPRGGSGSQQLLNGSKEIWTFFQRHQL